MKTFVVASLTLGLVLAAPWAGSAATGASNPLHRHPVAHHKVVDHGQAVDARAVADAHPTVAPTFGMLPYPPIVYDVSGHEADGLSRNPDDCVRWGCVDNN
jgi:hypothetical protein